MFLLGAFLGDGGPVVDLVVAAVVLPQLTDGVLHALGVALALADQRLDLSVWSAGRAQLAVLGHLRAHEGASAHIRTQSIVILASYFFAACLRGGGDLFVEALHLQTLLQEVVALAHVSDVFAGERGREARWRRSELLGGVCGVGFQKAKQIWGDTGYLARKTSGSRPMKNGRGFSMKRKTTASLLQLAGKYLSYRYGLLETPASVLQKLR